MNLWIFLLCIAFVAIYGYLSFRFIKNLFKYGYIGNSAIYIGLSFLGCLLFSIYANLNPVEVPENFNRLTALASSVIGAVKMFALSFDYQAIGAFFQTGIIWNRIFAVLFVLTCALSLLFTSLSIVLNYVRMLLPKAKNFFRLFPRIKSFRNKDVHYIFTDSKMTITSRLARELNHKKQVVYVVVTRKSLKTQEGTEYKDYLISQGFDVITENFSSKYAKLIYRKSRMGLFKRNIYVYGMFSDDEESISFANYFVHAVTHDKSFIKVKGIYDKFKENKKDINAADLFLKLNYFQKRRVEHAVDRMKVFVTFHEHDHDFIYDFSSRTLGVVTTLSEYEMISSNFVMDHPISEFIDLNKLLASGAKDNKNLHVTFVGFGMINQAIFQKISQAYQLWGDNVNKIHYHILDREADGRVKYYANEYSDPNPNKKPKLQEQVLPIPFLYGLDGALESEDLGDYEILQKYIESIKKDRFKEDGFEVFIIAAGKSSTNVSIANKLQRALHNHIKDENLKNTHIFVRVGNEGINEMYKGVLGEAKENSKMIPEVQIFGNDALISDYIINKHLVYTELGVGVKKGFDREKYIAKYDDKQIYKLAKYCWHFKTKVGCLSDISPIWQLKPKLQLMGCELVETIHPKTKAPILSIHKDGKQISKEEFRTIFTELFEDRYEDNGPVGKAIAEMEHNRWLVASIILKNYEQRPLADYLADKNSKNQQETMNVCMTTNEGLRTIYKEAVKSDPKEEDEARKLTYAYDIYTLEYIFDSILRINEKNSEEK